MIMKKTIKAGIIKLTKFKKECLDFEYEGFQWWMMFGIDQGIFSTYKAAKHWQFKKIKYKNYSLVLWANKNKKPFTEVKITKNKISKYWVKIKTKKKRGGIWCAFSTKQGIPLNAKLQDSFLLKNKKGNYELRLVYEYDIPQIKTENLLAIDLGEKVIATVCGSFNNLKPLFLGKNIRGIRRHYSWLRKQLGKKKLLNKIIEIKDKEKRKINQELHLISKQIVSLALQTKSTIILGDLKGIRKDHGRRMNKFIYSMPFYKLTQMIIYKAKLLGLQVIKVKEYFTSKTCSKCGELGERRKQLFTCNCGYETNADYNASKNILFSSLDYMFSERVAA